MAFRRFPSRGRRTFRRRFSGPRTLTGHRNYSYVNFQAQASLLAGGEGFPTDAFDVVCLYSIGALEPELYNLAKRFDLAGILYSSHVVCVQPSAAAPPLITLAMAPVWQAVWIDRADPGNPLAPAMIADGVFPDFGDPTNIPGETPTNTDVNLPERVLWRDYGLISVGDPTVPWGSSDTVMKTRMRRIKCRGSLDEKQGIYAQCTVHSPVDDTIGVTWTINGALYLKVRT